MQLQNRFSSKRTTTFIKRSHQHKTCRILLTTKVSGNRNTQEKPCGFTRIKLATIFSEIKNRPQ